MDQVLIVRTTTSFDVLVFQVGDAASLSSFTEAYCLIALSRCALSNRSQGCLQASSFCLGAQCAYDVAPGGLLASVYHLTRIEYDVDNQKSFFATLAFVDSEVSAFGSNAELFLNERDKDEKD
ncbi:hypothetical protein L1887_05931 [Cichorium endivia]|nr:hypothetical protein L1887_05931 [Cichorium endivia]